MVDVVTEIVIHKPLEWVADYAANPDHAPAWYVNIKSVEWKTSKMIAVGSQTAFRAQFLGRHLSYTYEIVEYVPCHKLVMRTAEGPFPMETTYLWQSVDNGKTRMTLRNAGHPSGFSKLFTPMMASMMKKANTKDLQKLKALLEAS